MTERTDAPEQVVSVAFADAPKVSIFLATACGLGYLPKAPGTWGSLGGVLVAAALFVAVGQPRSYLPAAAGVTVIVAFVGVWVSGRAAQFWKREDPQQVVIDEVSGQHLTLLLGCALPVSRHTIPAAAYSVLNWKYLLLGFILFRVFDIWKPFPARQAEGLPGGWGIMADDWIAGVYAALVLWIARAVGL
jgi:phosphatidylglycerophosphatase A